MSNKYYRLVNYILLILCVSHVCISQNVAPSLTATGNLEYCPGSQVNIVTDFDIFDPDDTEIEALFIQISTGYVQGEDILLLTGLHPNIVAIWNANEGKLSMYGNGTPLANYTDLIAATKAIVYQSNSNTPIIDKTFSITIGDANYLPITDHYYEFVPSLGIFWTAARAAAASRTYFGLQGYLATITIVEEAQLVGKQAAGAGWIGGSDAETEGTWKWVTGPEAGTVFWNGLFNGSTPNFAFWNTGEPNQAGDEDYAHITDPSIGIQGSWNDLPNAGNSSGLYQPKGYIVEYGGTPGDPILNIAASTNIRALSLPRGVPSDLNVCDSMLDGDDTNGLAEFDLTLNEVNILNGDDASKYAFSYYSDSDYNDLITNPSTFENTVANSQTVYVKIESNFSANCYREHSFTVHVNELPEVMPFFVFKNCDVDGTPDGFTDYNLAEAHAFIVIGDPELFNITYHLTITDANFNTNALNSEIFDNAIANVIYARVESNQGCFSISRINLEVSTTNFPENYEQEQALCDDDNDPYDGFYVFNLNEESAEFISQFPSGQNLSVSYFRNSDDAWLEQNEIIESENYTNETAFSQIIYVRVESDDNGECLGIGPHLQLTVLPTPEFEIEQSEIYCLDSQPVSLSAFSTNASYTYQWFDEEDIIIGNNARINGVISGTYTVIATSDLGCQSPPISYTVLESSVANIGMDDVTIVELSNANSISINNSDNNLGIGDYEFTLNNIEGPYQNTPFFNNVQSGLHVLHVRDKKGCGIKSLEVFILGFPKYFTPNNDGINDRWQIKGLSDDFLNTSKVSIFDRYGKLIKQISAKNGSWDGTLNGQKLASNDYWFIVELVESAGNIRIFRGHFSLLR